MEIIAIERRIFEQMIQSFENLKNQVRNLCGNNHDNTKWLDNSEVCEILKISKRTLQSYRDNGNLPYSQIGHKCYYRVEDIERTVNQQKK